MTDEQRAPFLDKSHPQIWKAMNAVSAAVAGALDDAGVERQTVELMYVRISQINGCAYCLDLHVRRATDAGVSPRRLAQLPAWRDSGVFWPGERAALAIAEAVTRLPEPAERQAALAEARELLGETAFAALEWGAVSMNAYNRISILSEFPVEIPVTTTVTDVPDSPDASGDAGSSRFEITVDGVVAGTSSYLDTDVQGDPQRIFSHTQVDDAYAGRGLASELTREALAATVAAGRRIVPACPYVKTWLQRDDTFAEHVDAVTPAHLQLLDPADT